MTINLLEDDIRCPLPLFSSRLSPAPPLHSHSVRFPPLLRQPTNSTMWPCVRVVSLPLPPLACLALLRRSSPATYPCQRGARSRAAGGGRCDGYRHLQPLPLLSFLPRSGTPARALPRCAHPSTVREEEPPRNRSCRQHMYDTSLLDPLAHYNQLCGQVRVRTIVISPLAVLNRGFHLFHVANEQTSKEIGIGTLCSSSKPL